MWRSEAVELTQQIKTPVAEFGSGTHMVDRRTNIGRQFSDFMGNVVPAFSK